MKDHSIKNKERLLHILESIDKINGFVEKQSKTQFLKDEILQNAVLFQFAIIGEAIVHVDKDLLGKYSYPWHHVRAFRNFILHEYHAIEIRIVWETIIRDLPGLRKMIDSILQTEFSG